MELFGYSSYSDERWSCIVTVVVPMKGGVVLLQYCFDERWNCIVTIVVPMEGGVVLLQ